MRKIRLAQIGINLHSHAKQIFRSISMQSDIFELAGYVIVEDEREKFKSILSKYEGYPELTLSEVLNDPTIEAVTIETEEKHLTKYAIMAAEHGKHIHMEKPGGCSLKDFEQLINIMKKTQKIFHTGYMYRYNPYVKELLDFARKGELGDIISVDAQMSCKHKNDVREWLTDYPGGMMFFLGCHLIDLVMLLKGKPENIIPLNKSSGLDNINAKDVCFTVLEYPSGVSTVSTCDIDIGGYMRRHLTVTGTKKTVELKPLEYGSDAGLIYTDRTIYSEASWSHKGSFSTSDGFPRYDLMMRDFALCVSGEKENEYTYDYELTLYKTILCACGVKK